MAACGWSRVADLTTRHFMHLVWNDMRSEWLDSLNLRCTGPLLTNADNHWQPWSSSNIKNTLVVSSTSSVGVGRDLFLVRRRDSTASAVGPRENITQHLKTHSDTLEVWRWQRTERVSHPSCHGPAVRELADSPQESLFMSASVQCLKKKMKERKKGVQNRENNTCTHTVMLTHSREYRNDWSPIPSGFPQNLFCPN